MQTTTPLSNCITYTQLHAYVAHTCSKEESAQLYQHIANCELCACAVNGFTAIPFTAVEIENIHHQLHLKINATHAIPVLLARIAIVTISLASVFGFYQFTTSYSNKQPLVSGNEQTTKTTATTEMMELPTVMSEKKITVEEKKSIFIKKHLGNKIIKNITIPVEPIERIPVKLLNEPTPIVETITKQHFNADVIYIYDLKVTDYNQLYFTKTALPINFGNYTPSYKEGKQSMNTMFEKEPDAIIPANRTLKKGLAYFNNENYKQAINEFQVLLQNNSNDVNALFYEAICFYQEGNYNKAIKNLDAVLANTNNVFHPEAKWNLALVNLKTGNKSIAKQLLQEIVMEKGFYAKKAEAKLKSTFKM
jgi:Tetratricopeptide repeat